MKNFLILALFTLVALVGNAQEIHRPGGDTDDFANCGTATHVAGPSFANAIDSSGTATSTHDTVAGTNNLSTIGVTKCQAHVFASFASASAAYSSLTLNINTACTDDAVNAGGSCFIDYSLDNGTSWVALASDNSLGGWGQRTNSVTLSTSQDLTLLRIRLTLEGFGGCTCGGGGPTAGSASMDVFDVWTSGVIASVANTRTASESVTISPVVGLNRRASISETLSISPAISAVYGASRSTPESLGITPTVSYIHNGKSVTSDNVTLADSPVRVAGLHFALSESLSIAPSTLVVFPRFASETVGVADSIAIRQAPKRNFSESVSLSISGVGSAAGIRALSESVSINDSSIRQVGLGRGLAESGGFADTFARKFGYRPGPIEVVGINGIVNLGYAGRPFVDVQVQPVIVVARTVRPLISESLTLSPAVLASLPRFKLISEVLGFNPTTLVSHAAHRFTVESGTWRDVLSSTTINVTPHAEKNTIGQSVTLSEVLVVSVRSSSKKRAVIVMSL